ncbi:hypothetical protein T07_1932 [Trichinella nelsoni]|uniref:Uncharacterized protein n=1 Tax=Trichinella nelsoni TaxID=6336 RepID=A0A0V0RRZ9_9BILA|nr:hypothetical protein T07_1932 [Trichinella nelsoni]
MNLVPKLKSRQNYSITEIGVKSIKCKFSCVALPVLKRSYSRMCLPENVCKFLFDRDALAYVALVSLIASLRRAVRLQFNEWSKEKAKSRKAQSRTREDKRLGKTSSLEGLKICDEIHLSRHAEACFD